MILAQLTAVTDRTPPLWVMDNGVACCQLRAMSTGFVELSTVALGDFGQLVRQLISSQVPV